jgi:hypothetical protein
VPDASDILELLAADHHRIGSALADGGGDLDLSREISMHLYAEEEVLHPVLRREVANGDDLADDLLEVDRQLLVLLVEVEEKGLSPLAVELRDVFGRHRDAFATAAEPARAQVASDELARLGEVLLATLAEAPTHPHPALAGERGSLKPLLDAAASTVDHLRDRLHEHGDEHPKR